MKKIFVLAFCLLLFLFPCSNIFAQAGLFAGFQVGYSTQKPSFKSIEFNRDDNFLYGLHAGAKFFMFAVEANYFQATHVLKPKESFIFDWAGLKIDYRFIGLNLKYILSLLVLRPYLTVGYGYYTIDIHHVAKAKDKGYNLGLGAELVFGERFSFLVEGKYHHVKLKIQDRTLGFGNFTLSGGMNLNF